MRKSTSSPKLFSSTRNQTWLSPNPSTCPERRRRGAKGAVTSYCLLSTTRPPPNPLKTFLQGKPPEEGDYQDLPPRTFLGRGSREGETPHSPTSTNQTRSFRRSTNQNRARTTCRRETSRRRARLLAEKCWRRRVGGGRRCRLCWWTGGRIFRGRIRRGYRLERRRAMKGLCFFDNNIFSLLSTAGFSKRSRF